MRNSRTGGNVTAAPLTNSRKVNHADGQSADLLWNSNHNVGGPVLTRSMSRKDSSNHNNNNISLSKQREDPPRPQNLNSLSLRQSSSSMQRSSNSTLASHTIPIHPRSSQTSNHQLQENDRTLSQPLPLNKSLSRSTGSSSVNSNGSSSSARRAIRPLGRTASAAANISGMGIVRQGPSVKAPRSPKKATTTLSTPSTLGSHSIATSSLETQVPIQPQHQEDGNNPFSPNFIAGRQFAQGALNSGKKRTLSATTSVEGSVDNGLILLDEEDELTLASPAKKLHFSARSPSSSPIKSHSSSSSLTLHQHMTHHLVPSTGRHLETIKEPPSTSSIPSSSLSSAPSHLLKQHPQQLQLQNNSTGNYPRPTLSKSPSKKLIHASPRQFTFHQDVRTQDLQFDQIHPTPSSLKMHSPRSSLVHQMNSSSSPSKNGLNMSMDVDMCSQNSSNHRSYDPLQKENSLSMRGTGLGLGEGRRRREGKGRETDDNDDDDGLSTTTSSGSEDDIDFLSPRKERSSLLLSFPPPSSSSTSYSPPKNASSTQTSPSKLPTSPVVPRIQSLRSPAKPGGGLTTFAYSGGGEGGAVGMSRVIGGGGRVSASPGMFHRSGGEILSPRSYGCSLAIPIRSPPSPPKSPSRHLTSFQSLNGASTHMKLTTPRPSSLPSDEKEPLRSTPMLRSPGMTLKGTTSTTSSPTAAALFSGCTVSSEDNGGNGNSFMFNFHGTKKPTNSGMNDQASLFSPASENLHNDISVDSILVKVDNDDRNTNNATEMVIDPVLLTSPVLPTKPDIERQGSMEKITVSKPLVDLGPTTQKTAPIVQFTGQPVARSGIPRLSGSSFSAAAAAATPATASTASPASVRPPSSSNMEVEPSMDVVMSELGDDLPCSSSSSVSKSSGIATSTKRESLSAGGPVSAPCTLPSSTLPREMRRSSISDDTAKRLLNLQGMLSRLQMPNKGRRESAPLQQSKPQQGNRLEPASALSTSSYKRNRLSMGCSSVSSTRPPSDTASSSSSAAHHSTSNLSNTVESKFVNGSTTTTKAITTTLTGKFTEEYSVPIATEDGHRSSTHKSCRRLPPSTTSKVGSQSSSTNSRRQSVPTTPVTAPVVAFGSSSRTGRIPSSSGKTTTLNQRQSSCQLGGGRSLPRIGTSSSSMMAILEEGRAMGSGIEELNEQQDRENVDPSQIVPNSSRRVSPVGVISHLSPTSTSTATIAASVGAILSQTQGDNGILDKGKLKKSDALAGVVAFVDVRTSDGDDAGMIFVDMLKSMGARVTVRPGTSLTHIIFKSGRPSTMHHYRLASEPKPFLVGISWVVRCAELAQRVDEKNFVLETGTEVMFQRRRRSMEPKALASLNSGLIQGGGGFSTDQALKATIAASIERARRKTLQFAPKIGSPLAKRTYVLHTEDEDDEDAEE